MENRIYNFNPGPAMQPLEVLQEAQAEFLNFAKSGMSIIEISHRSKQYEQVHNQAKADIKELMGLGDDYEVLFCQGGASMQFTMIPQNFAVDGKVGNYVLSGSFATKAYDEAKLLNRGFVAASSKDRDFKHIPTQDEIKLSDNAAYLHLCYNNTIYGTEYHYIPETGDVPLIADMSSDMLSRPLDFSKFSLIYAGAQKNLGPAGADQRLHGIQPPHSRKNRCRKPAGSLSKGDGGNDPAHHPQGKIRESAAAVRPDHPSAGRQPPAGVQRTADAGLCAEPV